MDDDDNCIVTGIMGGDDVLLNGWMFCCAHSREYCHKCYRDHRMANNQQFELTDQEYELLTDYGTEDLADRRPICARNLWKRLPGGTTACEFHGEMGCSKCFDFKEQVLRHKGVDLALLQPAAMSPAAVAGTVTSTAAAQPAPNAADSSTQVPGQPTAATAEAGASTSISTTKCWGCGVASSPVVKLRKCAACKRARYCSKGCQHQHYPEHKAQCKQWRDE